MARHRRERQDLPKKAMRKIKEKILKKKNQNQNQKIKITRTAMRGKKEEPGQAEEFIRG